jgi:uncharacterized protein YdhG (YjbR/CyaY superfamily)
MMMERTASGSIDEYITGFPPEIQARLQEMRAVIREAVPDATESISYAIPTFDLKRKHLVHFAAFKHHIGFYPTASGIAQFARELQPYKTAKGSVQFPFGQPLPKELIVRMVQFRIAEIAGL